MFARPWHTGGRDYQARGSLGEDWGVGKAEARSVPVRSDDHSGGGELMHRYTVEVTIETSNEEEGRRVLDVMAEQAGARVEVIEEAAGGGIGQVIFLPKQEFGEADTDVRSISVSKQDAEVCDKAVTAVLDWWLAGYNLGLLPEEGSQKQLQAFPFQRLAALAERYQEAG
jgi:hypothetical protein